MAEKSPNKVKKYLKNQLLRFVRRFYDENTPYVDPLIERWTKGIVKFVLDIFLAGFVLFLALVSLKIILPYHTNWLNLGTRFWHVPIIIIGLGMIYWTFQDIYRFLRKDYR